MADISLVGTRVGDDVPSYARLLEAAYEGEATLVCIAAAYWDAPTVRVVCDWAAAAQRDTRLVLWTLGGSKNAWKQSAFLRDAPHVDARFVDSPEPDGIFHVKLGGVGDERHWTSAVVGSGNLTKRGFGDNVELGVHISGDAPVLSELRAWFLDVFDHATHARDIDWELAIERAPQSNKPRGEDVETRVHVAAPVRASSKSRQPAAPPASD